MTFPKLARAFFIPFILTTAIFVGSVVVINTINGNRPRAARNIDTPLATPELRTGVNVYSQLDPSFMERVRAAGFRTIVDLRPENEAFFQVDTTKLRSAANKAGITFIYLPTPADSFPDEIVDELGATLAQAQGPVLLYCRSGQRAARAWALAEASRPGGLTAPRIASAVRKSGHPIDDLMPAVNQRIANRAKL